MPKSKHRKGKNGKRIKHKFKIGIDYTQVDKEKIDLLRNDFATLELVAEMKLPMGNADDTDLYLLRDFIQWGIVAATVRDWLPLDVRENACSLLNLSARATVNVQLRGRRYEHHFVCTGQELQLIREGIRVVGDLMDESLKECPVQMVTEWSVMREYMAIANAKGGKISIDEKELKAAMKRLRRIKNDMALKRSRVGKDAK